MLALVLVQQHISVRHHLLWKKAPERFQCLTGPVFDIAGATWSAPHPYRIATMTL